MFRFSEAVPPAAVFQLVPAGADGGALAPVPIPPGAPPQDEAGAPEDVDPIVRELRANPRAAKLMLGFMAHVKAKDLDIPSTHHIWCFESLNPESVVKSEHWIGCMKYKYSPWVTRFGSTGKAA